jgi:polyhydroxyalkanoate synthesis regulator phasin
MALRSELVKLKTRVDDLQEQVRTLEARLDD